MISKRFLLQLKATNLAARVLKALPHVKLNQLKNRYGKHVSTQEKKGVIREAAEIAKDRPNESGGCSLLYPNLNA
jgi:hypothetical protein